MNSRHIPALLAALLTFAACGGGSSSTPPPPSPPPPPPPPVNEAMGGFWAGVLTFDMTQTSELFVGLVSEDGRFSFISAESDIQFTGSQQVDVAHVVGSGLGYADPGATWLDMTPVTAVSTDGTVDERNTYSGIWSTASGESGSFDFFYDQEYERDSSLALLEGAWTAYDDMGVPVATFTIDAGGAFNGQNVNGCVSSGTFSIIDPNYNAYSVDSTISNCFIAGDYFGLAAVGDISAVNDAIILTISNDDRAIVLGLEK
ncbi:MAG: hypothetical protein OEW59_02980 [Gammaproteobacteria bacterium]|nr:hypothetical protein [Gammaproteobacteria bacterium]